MTTCRTLYSQRKIQLQVVGTYRWYPEKLGDLERDCHNHSQLIYEVRDNTNARMWYHDCQALSFAATTQEAMVCYEDRPEMNLGTLKDHRYPT